MSDRFIYACLCYFVFGDKIKNLYSLKHGQCTQKLAYVGLPLTNKPKNTNTNEKVYYFCIDKDSFLLKSAEKHVIYEVQNWTMSFNIHCN